MNKDLINLIRLMNDKPIAFNKHYVFLGTGINGAVMLSQLVFWADKTKNKGWIYKTSKEWTAETGLTRREQDTARSKLKKLGFIEEHLHGTPAKVHYKVLENNLYEALIKLAREKDKIDQESDKDLYAQIRQTECTNPPNLMHKSAKLNAQIRQTNTENTTENTTDIIKSEKSKINQSEKRYKKTYSQNIKDHVSLPTNQNVNSNYEIDHDALEPINGFDREEFDRKMGLTGDC